jgi:2-oxo-4-hydroxy-4-carboxy-5-ureidoimidazoline decarboxylase
MTLQDLNALPPDELRRLLATCCGAKRWIDGMVGKAPFADEAALFRAADAAWSDCVDEDRLEAFSHHPKIGDLDSLKKKFASTQHLAASEQGNVAHASEGTLLALRDGNDAYEKKNGFIFIVCATGKSAEEMLALLQSRLANDRETELSNASAEQHKITRLRLQKLIA